MGLRGGLDTLEKRCITDRSHCAQFHFNVISCRQYMTALNFSRRLAESYVTVMPSIMCKD